MTCSLCQTPSPKLCEAPPGRSYFLCPLCDLVFLDPALHLGPDNEKLRYLEHNNDENDAQYRAFLSRVWTPLSQKLSPGANGLDYGSGPSPVMGKLIRESGYEVALYDPFFHPERAVLDRTYDFIVCCETAEHFFEPKKEFDLFCRLLKPGGWLGIQTQRLEDRVQFENWYYHRDPTHVTFYSLKTMEWIASHYGYSLENASAHVVLFNSRD